MAERTAEIGATVPIFSRIHAPTPRNAKTFTNRNALGVGETLDYDLYRKRTRVEDPRGFIERHFYDANGLLVKRVQADGAITFFENTPDLLRFKKTDALGFTTHFSYLQNDLIDGQIEGGPSDTFGNVVLEQDALGNTIETQYDFTLFDQPTSVKDKNGAIGTMSYYAVDDEALGQKKGKLAEVRLAQLGSRLDVLLQRFTYNPDGTLRERVEFLDAGDPTRTRTTDWTYLDDGLNVGEILETGADGSFRRRTFSFDALGRKSSETLWREASALDPTRIPLTTEFEYDELDRLVLQRDPLGNEAVTVFDANGQIQERRVRARQPDGSFVVRVVEQRRYDLADRVVGITDVLGGETLFGYDEVGHVTRTTDPTGASLRFEYDAVGRRTAVIDGNGHRGQTVYDPAGRIAAQIDANGNAATFGYDALGRQTSGADALGNTTTLGYDAVGNNTQTTDPRAQLDPALRNSAGVTELRTFDELGRVTSVLDANDGQTLFEYDLSGHRTKITDALGQLTQFVFDDLGRLREIIDPVLESPDRRETRVVNAADQVIVRTDRVGNVTRIFHDALGRETQRRFLPSNDLETRSYDLFGNLASQTNPELTYTFEYDAKNRLISKTDNRLFRSLQFAYDAADRLVQKTDYQGDTTNFLYDGTGRLVAEQNAAYVQVSYHFDAAGRLLDRILSNGARTGYGYDAANRRTSLTQRAADGTQFESLADSYDPNGNLTQRTDSSGTTLYGYDALNRLTSADLPGALGGGDRAYQYDAVGNRSVETIGSFNGGFDRFYVTGPGNRLLGIIDGGIGMGPFPFVRSFDYDANGALLTMRDGSGTVLLSLPRNDRGQVVSAGGTAFLNHFGYDPRRLRVRRDDASGAHLFHLEGDRLESVYDGSGNLRSKYLRGAVIDEVVNGYLFDGTGTALNLTYHHDGVNSVTALTGHTGSVEETRRFAPFGELLSETGTVANELRFTGREQDPDSGLYYFRARYYDPEIGRFLSEDPLGFRAGVNFYSYVENNPINRNDPTGNELVLFTGGVNVSLPTLLVAEPLAPQLTLSLTLGFSLDTRVSPPVFDADLVVTGEFGPSFGSAGILPGSAFLRAGGSFDPEVTTKSLTGLSTSTTADALLLSGSATFPRTGGAIFEAGITTPSIGVSGTGGLGFSVPDLIGSGVDFLKGLFGSAPPAGSASGGFVLYPSRPNLNQVQQVYEK